VWRNRKFICSVLIVFLVNAVFFGFSSEALADSASHRDQITSHTEPEPNSSSDSANPDSSQGEKACNHGCHASSHMQAQVSCQFNLVAPDNELCRPTARRFSAFKQLPLLAVPASQTSFLM
jgi:hypothetical protein